ncbi:hypothetical protein [Microbacterium hydrocarbonoxydans]|uniref:hypothetical protein n=1 Tax=Microbacterium hydrocarbonoxydans TaxID=273678 RepID=UPI003D964D36
MSTEIAVKITCAEGHRRTTVARFATFNDPAEGEATWWAEWGAEETRLGVASDEGVVVKEPGGQHIMRVQFRIACTRCGKVMSARGTTLDAALTSLTRDGARVVEMSTLVRAASR